MYMTAIVFKCHCHYSKVYSVIKFVLQGSSPITFCHFAYSRPLFNHGRLELITKLLRHHLLVSLNFRGIRCGLWWRSTHWDTWGCWDLHELLIQQSQVWLVFETMVELTYCTHTHRQATFSLLLTRFQSLNKMKCVILRLKHQQMTLKRQQNGK